MDLRVLRSLAAAHETVLRRHSAVEQALDDLVDVAEKGEEDESSYTRVVSLLSALRRELLEHFDLEARSGILSRAVEAAPRISRRATRVAEEHDELASRLAEILERVLGAVVCPDSWAGIREAYAEFSERLIAHERAEDALLREAYLDDHGGGD
ncbi:MAG: hemerythrin domain-containing protein [Myxococcota bacterium]